MEAGKETEKEEGMELWERIVEYALRRRSHRPKVSKPLPLFL